MIDIFGKILYTAVFIVLPLIFGITNIKASKNCKLPIPATYKGYDEQIYRGIRNCYLRFSYTYNGCKYNNTTEQLFDCNEAEQLYIENNTYTIFINEKNPSEFICSQRTPLGAYACIGIAIFFLVLLLII